MTKLHNPFPRCALFVELKPSVVSEFVKQQRLMETCYYFSPLCRHTPKVGERNPEFITLTMQSGMEFVNIGISQGWEVNIFIQDFLRVTVG